MQSFNVHLNSAHNHQSLGIFKPKVPTDPNSADLGLKKKSKQIKTSNGEDSMS